MKQSLHILKERFQFSSAHFLILDSQTAEKLHGHNYRVGVKLIFDRAKMDQNQGFFCHFGDVKGYIKQLTEQWDERVLLPDLHPEMTFEKVNSSLSVKFRERHYVFPADEVLRLPLSNTSVENLSHLFATALAEKLALVPFERLLVTIEEAPGQGASAEVRGRA